MELEYRLAEAKAKIQKNGIWGMKGHYESPGAYKKALKEADAASGSGPSGASVPTPGTNKGPLAGANKVSTGKPSSPGTFGPSRTGVKGGVVVVGKVSAGKPSPTKKAPSSSAASVMAATRKKPL